MNKKIVFQVLTCGNVSAALAQLHESFTMRGVPTGFTVGHRGYLAPDRCAGIWDWLEKTDSEYLVQCDEDIVPPVDILNIVKHEKDFVAAPALVAIHNDIKINCAPLAEDEGSFFPGEGLKEVVWAGTGLMCYKRSSMLKFIEVYGAPFSYDLDEKGLRKDGVDVNFCRKARAIGLRVWADRSMLCGHLRAMLFVPGKKGEVFFRKQVAFWRGDDVENYTPSINEAMQGLEIPE